MYEKLKLKNDATYEGINWNFLCTIFCSHFLLARTNNHAKTTELASVKQQPEETRLLHDTQYCSVPSNHTRTIPAAFGPLLINMV
jgi:hypothetical protein